MLVSDFNYHLPEDLIAQKPLLDRSASRLLHVEKAPGELRDRYFREFPDLLRPDDLLVFNNTRVFPARLLGRRSGVRAQPLSAGNPASREFLQGEVEVLLTRRRSADPNVWECLVRPGRKIGVGETLLFGEGSELQAEVLERGAFGERVVRFRAATDFFAVVERIGHVPLPPYVARSDDASDRERYQTVYAKEHGSVAAPTAGLHFTGEILSRIRRRGIETAEITLQVGLGTFQPLRAERVEENKLHRETYSISPQAEAAINRALETGRRIVAIGTTTVRSLEDSAASGGRVHAGAGEAGLFIYPGHQFRVTGALLTNFHLPQSSLLMLVSALGGKDRVLSAYEHAVEQKYRFYSYGDCMFLE
jgi:S-adenosylmethionine:tRNA ribosyltransferase-isomerase